MTSLSLVTPSTIFAVSLLGMLAIAKASPEAPTYVDDVLPRVFGRVCNACHDGSNSVLPNFLKYEVALEKSAKIYEYVMIEMKMPPPTSGIEMSDEDRQLLADWIDAGSPLN